MCVWWPCATSGKEDVWTVWRSIYTCVVCRYLDYGEESWKSEVRNVLSGVRTYVSILGGNVSFVACTGDTRGLHVGNQTFKQLLHGL